ncbi:MAG: Rieske (2Fe-2S) protein [Streptomycetaceae bacterium]|nr:Rieske (2Fe-2S) protein [Streptomycetaceae bacterium]
MNDQSACPASPATRRTVLQCAALTGTAGLALTACSSGSSGGGSTASASTTDSTGSSASSGEVELGMTSEVPVGGAKIFREVQIIVTQPKAGTFKAFTAICTHAGCTVGGVANGAIFCPCHGSLYNVETGAVLGGPAPSALPSIGLDVQGGKLFAKPSS